MQLSLRLHRNDICNRHNQEPVPGSRGERRYAQHRRQVAPDTVADTIGTIGLASHRLDLGCSHRARPLLPDRTRAGNRFRRGTRSVPADVDGHARLVEHLDRHSHTWPRSAQSPGLGAFVSNRRWREARVENPAWEGPQMGMDPCHGADRSYIGRELGVRGGFRRESRCQSGDVRTEPGSARRHRGRRRSGISISWGARSQLGPPCQGDRRPSGTLTSTARPLAVTTPPAASSVETTTFRSRISSARPVRWSTVSGVGFM